MMTKTKSKWWAKYKLVFAIPIIILSLSAFTNDRLNLSTGKISLQTQLNQVDLSKQFLGTWTYEMAKDTTYTLECKSYGNELDFYWKRETKGKIIKEGRTLWNYDKKSDKLLKVLNSSDKLAGAMWFTTKNVCVTGTILDITNPTKFAPIRKIEFNSSDLSTISLLINDKYVNQFTLTRVKN